MCVEIASNKLEPHRIAAYLYELASEFHSYWNMGKDNTSKRFIEKNNTIKNEKIVFLKDTILNIDLLEKHTEEIDGIFHQAALASVQDSLKKRIPLRMKK